MHWTELDTNGTRTIALIFDKGDDVVTTLTDFATRARLGASSFTGLGAFSEVVLGFFDADRKDYEKNAITEQVEVVSLVGDITLGADAEPTVHAHVVVAKRDGSAHGGHLLEARVWPTLELILTETPAHLRRRYDAETGLALIIGA